ncbi:MAG: pyrroline-5-carboxylate reductase [Treponema sp.]|nr:pyrroline-5-carboxylate reductase [Treponema sp.]
MKLTISCIGSGNMGSALMKAVAAAGPVSIGFSDSEPAKAEEAAAALGGRVYKSNREAVDEGTYVFLAVKPQVMHQVLVEIAPTVKQRLSQAKERPLTLVSMAAGWSIGQIQSSLGLAGPGQAAPVVRIMPNTPALVARGVIAMAAKEVGPETLGELEKLLSPAGMVDHIEEKYMDSVTGLSGAGPAFAYIFMEALSDGGVRAGLPRDMALRHAAQTLLGSAAMYLESKRPLGELKDMVSSPGGATIAGIAALENGAFRGSVINAVEAAWRRAAELGKES